MELLKKSLLAVVVLICWTGSLSAKPLAVVQESDLCGVIDTQGNFVVPLGYDRIVPWSNGALMVKKGDNCGVLGADGKVIVPVEYLNILIPSHGNTYLVENHEAYWGAYSAAGKMLLPAVYDEITATDKGYTCFAVRQGAVWKFIHGDGSAVSKEEFDYIGEFSEEGLAVVRKNGKWGYATHQGQIAVSPQFEEAKDFCSGLAAVKQQGKWGFIDKNGLFKIAPQFAEVYSGFSEGLAAVQSNEGKGYIDKHGNLLIPRDSRYIGPFKNGMAEIREVKKKLNVWSSLAYGASIALGSIGLPPKNVLQSNEKRGFINRQGKEVVSTSYDEVLPFMDDMALVRKDRKWGAVSKDGKNIIQPKYLAMRPFGDGVAAVRTANGWQLIDKEEKVIKILPASIMDAGVLSEGILPVCVDEKWGYMNMDGEFVVTPRFMQAGSFTDL